MPLLFHLLIVAAISLTSYGGEAFYNSIACGASLQCGDSIDVAYPFFINNDSSTTINVTSYCGYPGMEMICEHGRTTLRLESVSYTVLDIDYGNNTVTVVDADVLMSGGDCPRVTHNVTVPSEAAWLNLSATGNANLAFFFDCVFTTGTTPPPVGIEPINCSSFP